MLAHDNLSKLSSSLNKLFTRQWTKFRHSCTTINRSTTLDEILEDEYQSLIREIDNLTEKSVCHFTFQNEKFEKRESSVDLTEILENHSDRVLKAYVTKHDSEEKALSLNTRDDLVNYVTEIVISRPKCNKQRCTCGTVKDASSSRTEHIKHQNADIQTERCLLDCPCGSSDKKLGLEKDTITHDENVQEVNTSEQKFPSNNTDAATTIPNCSGQTAEVQTSKLCVPANFEDFFKANNIQFSPCTDKKDCACEAYDVNEAVRKGIILPGHTVCVQKKKFSFGKKKKKAPSSSDSSDLSSEFSGTRKKEKTDEKKRNGKRKNSNSESSSSSPRGNEEGKTGCFGNSKKKRGQCDAYCQGVTHRQHSIQTEPVLMQDKGETTNLYGQLDGKTIQTATDSEIGVQMDGGRLSDHRNTKKSSENNQKAEDTGFCNKCGRRRRGCESGCRNTFVLPYASTSSRAIPPGDADSLRMLIKMQSKDTNRQFDVLLAEINQQKIEIRRLNDMYQRMVENFYEKKSSAESTKNKKSKHNISPQHKEGSGCGCSFSGECFDQRNKPSKSPRRHAGSLEKCVCSSNNMNGRKTRFGPVNTAVAIHMCDVCTVDISRPDRSPSPDSLEQRFWDGDKSRKERFNNNRKILPSPRQAHLQDQYDMPSQETSPKGDFTTQEKKTRGKKIWEAQENTVDTIYNNEKRYQEHRSDVGLGKTVDFSDGKYNEGDIIEKADIEINKPTNQAINEAGTETESTTDTRDTTRSGYSDRIMIWLKRSWISIKNKSRDCKRHANNRSAAREGFLNFCKSKTKEVMKTVLKSMKVRRRASKGRRRRT